MKRIKIYLYLAIAAAVIFLIGGLALNHEYKRMLVPLAIGLFWFFALYQKWTWGPSVCVFGLLLFASILHSVAEIWLFTCLLACLIAWNLSYFLFDIQISDLIHQKDIIVMDHLKRLGTVAGLSVIFIWISSVLRLGLSFGLVLVLGLILIFVLSRAILMVRESTPDV